MGKIKGWKKTGDNTWRSENLTMQIRVYESFPSGDWYFSLNQINMFGNTIGIPKKVVVFGTKEQAMKAARMYMRRNS